MPICRMTFAKGKSKKFFYRCYKNFDNKLFKDTLIKNLPETELSLKSLETTFSLTLKKFSPLKEKHLRYNKSSYMNRILRKANMTRSNVKRRYNLDGTTINFQNHKKEHNICVNILRKKTIL